MNDKETEQGKLNRFYKKDNLFIKGNPGGGRPMVYPTPEAMEQKISEYFDECAGEYVEIEKDGKIEISWKKEPKTLTVTGLALHLGFYGRAELYRYGRRTGFEQLIKRALTVIENAYEQRLQANNPTGSIFALKNMGWKDFQHHKLDEADPNDVLSEKSDEELLQMLQQKIAALNETKEG